MCIRDRPHRRAAVACKTLCELEPKPVSDTEESKNGSVWRSLVQLDVPTEQQLDRWASSPTNAVVM